MSENQPNEDLVTRLYELGVNLIPTLEDETQKEFDSLKKIIEKNKGEVVSFSDPVTIPLAYTMTKSVDSKKQKYNTTAFGWIKFTSATESIASLKEDLDGNGAILRFVILKTKEEASTESTEVAEALAEEPEEEQSSRRGSRRKTEEKKENKEEKADLTDEEVNKEEKKEDDEKKSEDKKEETPVDKVDEAIEELVSEEEK